MVLCTLQLNLDQVSATTYQTNNVSSDLNHNLSYTTTQNSLTKTLTSTNSVSALSSVKISLSQINTAAGTVKSQIIHNHKIPSYVTISNYTITMPQFLDLLTNGLIKISWGLNTPVNLRTVNYPNPGIDTVQSATLNSTEYINMAKSIKTFIDTNHRVPSYARSTKGRLTYGNLIFTFSKIFNFQFTNSRLPKIVTVNPWAYILHGKPIYITSDFITDGGTIDKNRIYNIINALNVIGVNAKYWGIGPNTHYDVLSNTTVPQNAIIVDIYGGACAGTIFEMGTNYYMFVKGTRRVLSIFWPPATDITGLDFLPRAHDDNFTPLYGTPGGFPNWIDLDNDGVVDPAKDLNGDGINEIPAEDGLAYPAQYLHDHGYSYLYSDNMGSIVSTISKMAYN